MPKSPKEHHLTAANLKVFPEVKTLTEDEIALLVSLMIHNNEQLNEVKREFEATAGKPISLAAMSEIRTKYSDEIKSRRQAIKEGYESLPISRTRNLIRCLKVILFDAMDKKKHKKWEKCGDGPEGSEYEEYVGMDHQRAKDTVLAIHKIVHDQKLLELSRAQLELAKERLKILALQRDDEGGEGNVSSRSSSKEDDLQLFG